MHSHSLVSLRILVAVFLTFAAVSGFSQSRSLAKGKIEIIKGGNVVPVKGGQQDIQQLSSFAQNPEPDPELVSIFPNPAREGFYVTIPDDDQGVLVVMGLGGEVVMIRNLDGYRNYIETDGLKNGFYFAQVKLRQNPPAMIKIEIER
jgi:hypothetical protein